MHNCQLKELDRGDMPFAPPGAPSEVHGRYLHFRGRGPFFPDQGGAPQWQDLQVLIYYTRLFEDGGDGAINGLAVDAVLVRRSQETDANAGGAWRVIHRQSEGDAAFTEESLLSLISDNGVPPRMASFSDLWTSPNVAAFVVAVLIAVLGRFVSNSGQKET